MRRSNLLQQSPAPSPAMSPIGMHEVKTSPVPAFHLTKAPAHGQAIEALATTSVGELINVVRIVAIVPLLIESYAASDTQLESLRKTLAGQQR